MAHDGRCNSRFRCWPPTLVQFVCRTMVIVSIVALGKNHILAQQEIANDSTGENSSQLAALFKSSTFQVTTRIFTSLEGDKMLSLEKTIDESYSNELKRAHLDITPQFGGNFEISDTFFYAAKGGKLMKWSQKYGAPDGVRECALSNQKLLDEEMFGKRAILHAPGLADWTQFIQLEAKTSSLDLASLKDYVIGPTRLLLLIEMNRHLLKPVGVRKPNLRKRRGRRDIFVEQDHYFLDLRVGSGLGTRLQLHVFYLQQLSGANSSLHQLPYQVMIALNTYDTMMFQFSTKAVHPIDPLNDHHASVMDFFSFPIGYACSGVLKDTSGVNKPRPASEAELHLKKLEQRQVVSFEAELSRYRMSAHKFNRQLFVAYDGYAKALRHDTLDHLSDSYSIQLHDLQFGHKYYIRAARNGGPGRRGNKATLSELSKTNAECYATRSLELNSKNKNEFEPLVPYADLVEMGVSHVRGMRAQVYEHESNELPPLIFHKVAYVDLQGRKVARYDPNISDDDQASPYSIVYYFLEPITGSNTAEANKNSLKQNPGDQLVRLEIYRAGSLLYQIEVHNFQWQLSNAPNGDRQDQLFSLQDRCASLREPLGDAGDRLLAENDETIPSNEQNPRPADLLLLELEYMLTSWGLTLTADQVLDMIKYAPTRNKALIRGLVSVTNSIYPTQIVNIKSHIKHNPPDKNKNKTLMDNIQDAKQIKILASLELAHLNGPPRPEYEIVSVGRGRFRDSYLDLGDYTSFPAKFDLLTFAGCFVEAAKLHSRAKSTTSNADESYSILFSFCNSFCQIDNRAVKRAAGDASGQVHYKSGVFEFLNMQSGTNETSVGDGDVCDIMELRVEGRVGNGLSAVARTATPEEMIRDRDKIKPWTQVYAILRQKIISLKLNDVKEWDNQRIANYQVDSLEFRIAHLELNSLRGELLQDSLSSGDQSSLLTGLGFVPNESRGFQLIDLTSETNYNFDEPSDGETQLMRVETTASADACRANCVANFQCKSYSTCLLDSSHVECIISPVDLHNRPLMKSLKDNLRVYKKANPNRAGSIRIDGRLLLIGGDGGSSDDGTGEGNEPKEDRAQEMEQTQGMVEFKVNNRCEIRSQRAIELFTGQYLRCKVTLRHDYLIPAQSIEHCAEVCLDRTKTFFKLTNQDKVELELGQTKSTELHDKLNKQMASFCSRFGFADLTSRSIDTEVLSKIRKVDKFRHTPGLCFNDRPFWTPNRWRKAAGTGNDTTPEQEITETSDAENHFDIQHLSLEMDTFRFDYLNLYKSYAGVRLLGSQVRRQNSFKEEANAEHEQQDFGLNKQLIREYGSARICAEACFSQSFHMCRSFNFIQMAKTDDRDRRKTYCVLNSITMAEAEKIETLDGQGGRGSLIATNHVDLIDEPLNTDNQQTTNLIYYHYEPHEAYSLDNVVLKLALNEPAAASSDNYEIPKTSPTCWHLSSLTILVLVAICLFGSISGFIAATFVTKRLKHLDSRLKRVDSSLELTQAPGENHHINDIDTR